jgi:hypothetical protein
MTPLTDQSSDHGRGANEGKDADDQQHESDGDLDEGEAGLGTMYHRGTG